MNVEGPHWVGVGVTGKWALIGFAVADAALCCIHMNVANSGWFGQAAAVDGQCKGWQLQVVVNLVVAAAVRGRGPTSLASCSWWKHAVEQ